MDTTFLGEKLIEAGLLHKRIAERAYQLYEARGHNEGYALDDWLQAEKEVESLLLLPSAAQGHHDQYRIEASPEFKSSRQELPRQGKRSSQESNPPKLN
jgi:hypothetical protein